MEMEESGAVSFRTRKTLLVEGEDVEFPEVKDVVVHQLAELT